MCEPKTPRKHQQKTKTCLSIRRTHSSDFARLSAQVSNIISGWWSSLRNDLGLSAAAAHKAAEAAGELLIVGALCVLQVIVAAPHLHGVAWSLSSAAQR